MCVCRGRTVQRDGTAHHQSIPPCTSAQAHMYNTAPVGDGVCSKELHCNEDQLHEGPLNNGRHPRVQIGGMLHVQICRILLHQYFRWIGVWDRLRVPCDTHIRGPYTETKHKEADMHIHTGNDHTYVHTGHILAELLLPALSTDCGVLACSDPTGEPYIASATHMFVSRHTLASPCRRVHEETGERGTSGRLPQPKTTKHSVPDARRESGVSANSCACRCASL